MSWLTRKRVLAAATAVTATVAPLAATVLPAQASAVPKASSVHTVTPNSSIGTMLSVVSSHPSLQPGATVSLRAGHASTGLTPSKVPTHARRSVSSTKTPSPSHTKVVVRRHKHTVHVAAHRHKSHGPYYIYDSAQASGIPSNASAVAGYVTGAYAWTQQDWARFHGQKITIDIVGGDIHAQVEDVESGGVPTSVIHQWAVSRLAQGQTPVIYSSGSYYPAVAAAMGNLKWHWWAASPTGASHLLPGSQATQYQWVGNAYDKSVSALSPYNLTHLFVI